MVLESQVLCTICKKPITSLNIYSICENCKIDPFKIEQLRTILGERKDYKKFIKTYSKSLPEIKNTNTKSVWNEIFSDDSKLNNQDQMTKSKIKTVASFIQTNKNIQLLDVGIGKAYLEEYLLGQNIKNINLHGIDISSIAIDDAKKRYKGHFKMCNALDIQKKYKKSYFDYIIALEVIEHISPKDILNFFHQVNYLLKPNGKLIISTPTNEHIDKTNINPSSHVRQYTITILATELKLTGFNVSRVKYFYAFKKHYFIKNILRLFFRNRWEENNITLMATKI